MSCVEWPLAIVHLTLATAENRNQGLQVLGAKKLLVFFPAYQSVC
jgi:hypothetical protein